MACKALIHYGQTNLGATDIYAGVTKGNAASESLLGRLGFERVEDRDTYTLFQLALSDNDQR
jgi:ribosomal-protein-serine acetyltransferase